MTGGASADFDAALTGWLQSAIPEALRPLLDAVSLLGGTTGWLLLIALAFWWSGSRLGLRVALVASLSSILNVLAKWMLAQPRPYLVSDRIQPLATSDGFGMPSGHAQGSAATWGALALWGGARWLWAAGAAMTFLAGLVRVYYGVHSPLQVAVGWLLGVAVVVAAAALEAPLVRWWGSASPPARLAVAVLPALAFFAGGLALRELLFAGWEPPAAWLERQRSIGARLGPVGGSVELLLVDAGALARWSGALLGTSLAAVHYTACPGRSLTVASWRQRAVTTALGLAGAGAVLGAGELLREWLGSPGELLRFAVLLWVVAVAAPRTGERLARPSFL